MREGDPAQLPDHSGVVVPPPFLYVVAFALGLLLQHVQPVHLLPPRVGHLVGGLCLGLWAVLSGWRFWTFRRARTSILPVKPTRALVTTGPFRVSRNPMYLALALLYVGVA